MGSDSDICLAQTEKDIASGFAVMAQLRPHLSETQFVEQVLLQRQQGYHLLLARQNRDVVGVAGFVVGHKLAWGKHIYVDDLVTCQKSRSKGVGKALMDWMCAYGRQNQCDSLHLDSGVQRFGAHAFYLREGMHIASHHFALDFSL